MSDDENISKKSFKIQYEEILSEHSGQSGLARELCLKRLDEDRTDALARLLLAKSYYTDGYMEFCLRELEELKKYFQGRSIDTLLEHFASFSKSSKSDLGLNGESSEVTLAEVDLEMDLFSAFSEAEEESSGNGK